MHGEGGLPVRDFDSGAGRLEYNGFDAHVLIALSALHQFTCSIS